MNVRRYVGSGAAAILLVATWHGVGSGVTPDPLPVRPTVQSGRPAIQSRMIQGPGSCSATACHGSMTPAPRDLFPSHVLRNEHSIWVTRDRHANAYQVLCSDRSRTIARNLSGGKVPAHEDARCLACHATSGTGPSAVAPVVVLQDGVSCESCHGPAERWLGAHTQLGWNRLSASEKETQYGMRPTKALVQRAAICVDCHVGSPGRDVNHDLIAAGHPRLNFEFAAFLANMPPHWVEDTRGNFPAQAWAIGQAATAKAALDLLHTRAIQAAKADHAASVPWPEFSEYDCFSCHHDLADQAWRKPAEGTVPARATSPWGSWYYPMALELARSMRLPEAGDLDNRFATLRSTMGGFGSDPAKVAGEAQALSGAIARWLEALPADAQRYDAPRLKTLIETYETSHARGVAPGWDGAAQRYLALQPLRLSLKALDPAWADAPLAAELKTLFQQLQFPTGFDSPRRYDPGQPGGVR